MGAFALAQRLDLVRGLARALGEQTAVHIGRDLDSALLQGGQQAGRKAGAHPEPADLIDLRQMADQLTGVGLRAPGQLEAPGRLLLNFGQAQDLVKGGLADHPSVLMERGHTDHVTAHSEGEVRVEGVEPAEITHIRVGRIGMQQH